MNGLNEELKREQDQHRTTYQRKKDQEIELKERMVELNQTTEKAKELDKEVNYLRDEITNLKNSSGADA